MVFVWHNYSNGTGEKYFEIISSSKVICILQCFGAFENALTN